MNLTERRSVCIRSNCDGFWWRVFTPEYSRNIWCELAVIVGFRETTVCLVRGEWGDSMEKRCSKGSEKFLRLPLKVPPFWSLSFFCWCYTNKIKAGCYFLSEAFQWVKSAKLVTPQIFFPSYQLTLHSQLYVFVTDSRLQCPCLCGVYEAFRSCS